MGVLETKREYLNKNVIQSARGAEAIVTCVYKLDPLSVVTEVHADFSMQRLPPTIAFWIYEQ